MELSELENRRVALVKEMPKDSVAILSSANRNYRTKDVENPYRQDSDFLYMTGISEPSLLNIIYEENGKIFSILFRDNTTEQEKIWNGERLSNSQISEKYGFTEIYNYKGCHEKLLDFIKNKKTIYIENGLNNKLDRFLCDEINNSRKMTKNRVLAKERKKEIVAKYGGGIGLAEMLNISPAAVSKWKLIPRSRAYQISQHGDFPVNFIRPDLNIKNKSKRIVALHSITQKLRLVKSDYEISLIKEAVNVSIKGHEGAMKKSKPGIYEYELDAEIRYIFNKNNMDCAYMSIVGGGNNACTLHYINNNDILKDKNLVLIDAAAECEGYASDITRTFPVNGKFTEEQSKIYDIVLEAQEKAIEFVKPGVTWDQVHEITIKIIVSGLIRLEILSGDIDEIIDSELYKEFFMHKTGHWLGLDVHDVGTYENKLFEPGMVITVEPGIYIDSSNKNVLEKWRGIGIRIEDDVLITKNGNEVLTKDLVKKRNEIETVCSH
jgi:Xaa-Pro aminopeptidase